jgi:hypothetical protein
MIFPNLTHYQEKVGDQLQILHPGKLSSCFLLFIKYNIYPHNSQLCKNQQQTISALHMPHQFKKLFNMIKCSLETEKIPDKSLIKLLLDWRSAGFYLLAQH